MPAGAPPTRGSRFSVGSTFAMTFLTGPPSEAWAGVVVLRVRAAAASVVTPATASRDVRRTGPPRVSGGMSPTAQRGKDRYVAFILLSGRCPLQQRRDRCGEAVRD